MKDFFKYVLATIVGLILTSIIMTIICIVSMAGMMASENMSQPVKENSILRIKLQGIISERGGEDDPLALLMNDADMENISLDVALDALKKAAKNDKVKGIYLEGGILGANPAELQELRQGLVEFKKSGKWIVAYADQYSRASYYLCSTADKVYLNPIGMLDWSGMASQPIFYKGLLEKVGIKMQVFKVGTYKSAVEPFICDQMSDANREQVTSFLGSIWGNMLKDVAKSRKMKAEELNALADSLSPLSDAEAFVKSGMVDKICYKSEVKAALKKRMELKDDDKLTFTTMNDVANAEDLNEKVNDEIAVYYAYGEIVDQPLSSFSSDHAIIGSEVVEDLQKLAKDEDVKAVVMRVNSPGGSAVASEQIWHAIKMLKEKKPVVVSMGGYAASGGYMISAPANYIVAEPTTVTGSIGIFGLIPNANELVSEKLGVTWDGVQTNKHTDYETNLVFGKDNDEEIKYMQSYVDRGYDTFLSIVAEGRGMTKEQVHEIAQGRVWVATDALPIKLVDKIGSLNDAVKKAAELAECSEYYTAPYPEKPSWFEQLLASTEESKDTYLDEKMHEMLGDLYEPVIELRKDCQRNRLQARFPFTTTIK